VLLHDVDALDALAAALQARHVARLFVLLQSIDHLPYAGDASERFQRAIHLVLEHRALQRHDAAACPDFDGARMR
jgi:hypothetical protein